MKTALIALTLVCITAFAVDTFAKVRNKITGVLLLVAPLAAAATIVLVSSKENVSLLDAFSKLLALEAPTARASFGLYAVIVLFFFGAWTLVKQVGQMQPNSNVGRHKHAYLVVTPQVS